MNRLSPWLILLVLCGCGVNEEQLEHLSDQAVDRVTRLGFALVQTRFAASIQGADAVLDPALPVEVNRDRLADWLRAKYPCASVALVGGGTAVTIDFPATGSAPCSDLADTVHVSWPNATGDRLEFRVVSRLAQSDWTIESVGRSHQSLTTVFFDSFSGSLSGDVTEGTVLLSGSGRSQLLPELAYEFAGGLPAKACAPVGTFTFAPQEVLVAEGQPTEIPMTVEILESDAAGFRLTTRIEGREYDAEVECP